MSVPTLRGSRVGWASRLRWRRSRARGSARCAQRPRCGRYDTLDIDVAPNTTDENLDRLATALNELECRLITDPADPGSWVAVPSGYFTPRSLRSASIWNLATRHGQLDLCFAPSGFPGGYRDLVPRAAERSVSGTTVVVRVASLEDVHASKRQANRAKDRVYLEQLPEQDA